MTDRTLDEVKHTTALVVESVQAYRCSDGDLFLDYEIAKSRQDAINRAAHANAILNNGGSVLQAMTEAGYPVPDHDEKALLACITKKTDISIRYWQCRDEPGYRVQYFTTNGNVHLYGDVGSWTGSYGGTIPVSDLIRHMQDTLRIKGE